MDQNNISLAGFNVSLPEQQNCYGAPDLHDGDRTKADQLAKINHNAFADQGLDAIATIAGGFGIQLQKYKQNGFADKVENISHFLSQSGCNISEQLMPLTASVCLSTPCSLKNIMREEQGALKLRQQLPNGIA